MLEIKSRRVKEVKLNNLLFNEEIEQKKLENNKGVKG